MRPFRPFQRQSQRERSGAATVETALVLPVFFMVMLGIVECGRAFMISQLLTNAAREGGRIAVMNGSSNTEVELTIEDIAQRTAGIAPADLDITLNVHEHAGNPSASNEVANARKRDLCEVIVRVNYDKVNLLPIRYLTGAQLVGQAAMRHE
ncbi:MAG: TadE/TadG family type IV pilus assembly protein [Planctomycetaceae bacterium]